MRYFSEKFFEPYKVSSDDDYIATLTSFLEDFKDEAKKTLDTISVNESFILPEKILRILSENILKIKEVLILQRDHNILEAYKLFNDFIRSNEIPFSFLSQSTRLPRSSTFYRFRLDDQVDKDKVEDPNYCLFHINLTRRFLVNNARFSASGFPSLYMSDCFITALYETMSYIDKTEVNKNDINLALLQNSLDVNVLDLSLQNLNDLLNKADLNISDFIQLLKLYPLIIAMHTIVDYKDRKANFKVEYILPNFITEYLHNKRSPFTTQYYIRYSSVRFFKQNKYNYCFMPSNTDGNLGICKTLENLFLTSNRSNDYYFLKDETLISNDAVYRTELSIKEFFNKVKVVFRK